MPTSIPGQIIDPTKNVLDLVHGEVKRLDDLRAENNRRIDSEIAHIKEVVELHAVHAKEAAAQQQASTSSLERVVDSTAKTLATQSSTMMSVIEGRLAALERSSYEGKGKQAVADPQMAALIALVESLRESRSTHTGRSSGLQSGWSWIIGAVGLIAGLIGIFAALNK